MQTSLYDASNGRNAGGNVEAITRSGSNNLHGNVYYFFRDDRFNANDPFVKARGLDRPVLERDQFGGTLGGPVVKDRVFFFFSYQGTREENGASLANSLTFPVVPAGLTDTNRTAAGLAAAFGLAPALITPSAIALLNQRLPNGEFVIPSLLGGPGTQMIGRILWDEFFSKTNWPRAAALAITMLVIVVVPIMLMQRAQNAVVEGDGR